MENAFIRTETPILKLMRSVISIALVGIWFSVRPVGAVEICPGDCDGSGRVSRLEITRAVGMIFGEGDPSRCAPIDVDENGSVTAGDLVAALFVAINGCPRSDTACNGSEALCERRYDEVSYPTTHNAMANTEDGFQSPNQTYNVSTQLRDGVRALMLDIYDYNGEITLCHADCELFGHRPLVDTLREIRTFLEERPREIVTLIFEAYVSAADTETVFADSGLLDYVHVQTVGEPWPTLSAMIESGKRLVVFSDRDQGERPWYLYVWDYAFETPYSFVHPQDFVCTPNRGDPSHSLFILNHFLTRPTGSINLARRVNFNPLFMDRALQCMHEDERLPNFVTVDFYELGDLLDVVDELNFPGTDSPGDGPLT